MNANFFPQFGRDEKRFMYKNDNLQIEVLLHYGILTIQSINHTTQILHSLQFSLNNLTTWLVFSLIDMLDVHFKIKDV